MATLSTVIGRGLDAAKPASPAAGYVYYSTDTGLLERYSGSAWEIIGGGGGANSVLAYKFSTTTTDADPGAGIIRANNATPASVTIFYIDDTVLGGSVDLSTFYANLAAGDLLYLRQADDASKYWLAVVVSVADGTGYYKVTVTISDSGSLPDDASTLVLTLLVKGGGSGAGSAQLWFRGNFRHDVGNVMEQAGVVDSWSLQTPALLAGTTRQAGSTGAGGFTDVEYACNVLHDTTPAAASMRGIRVDDLDGTPDMGMYCFAHARFCTADDQALVAGLSGGIPTPEATTALAVCFMKRSTDTNWQAARCDGTGWTYTDTGIAWASADWHNFEIVVGLESATLTAWYFIDGVEVAKVTSGLPSGTDITIDQYVGSYFNAAGDTGTYTQVLFLSRYIFAYNKNDLGVATALS